MKKDKDIVMQFPANPGCSQWITPNVKSYAGLAPSSKPDSFIRGEPDSEENLFYWFFECQKCKDEDDVTNYPLTIWLNGGPGGPSTYGLLQENGPYLMKDEEKGVIVENPFSWNTEMHLLYWDQPYWTGYSYAYKNGKKLYAKSEAQLSTALYYAMEYFYEQHPQYRECDLYITGESYAGKYIPNIALKFLEMNDKRAGKPINLKGIALGDGWMYPAIQVAGQLSYAFEMGFLDRRQFNYLKEMNDQLLKLIEKEDWKNGFKLCAKIDSLMLKCGGNPEIYDVRRWTSPPDYLNAYFDTVEVKKALNVSPSAIWYSADDTGPVPENLVDDNLTSVVKILHELLMKETTKGDLLRILFYTGNFDMACGFTGTEEILWKWIWDPDGNDEIGRRYREMRVKWHKLHRRVWGYKDDYKKTYGFVKELDNLMQVVIPNSGHMVPISQPEISREMIYNFIFKGSFPGYDPLDCDLPYKWEEDDCKESRIS